GEVFCKLLVSHALQAAVLEDEFLRQDARDDLQVVLGAFAEADLDRGRASLGEVLLERDNKVGMQPIARTLAPAALFGDVADNKLARLAVPAWIVCHGITPSSGSTSKRRHSSTASS